MGGLAVYTFRCNSEKVPVTGWQQLLLKPFRMHTPNTGKTCHVASLSAGNRFSRDCTSWQKKIQFWTSAYCKFQQLSILFMMSSKWTLKQPAYSSPTGDHMQITMTPGKLLAELILQRLAITMNHQLAHRTAQHSAEAKSRALLVAFAAFSRPHFSSVMPYTAALATAAIALCTHKFSVVAWLRQVRELRQMRFEQQSA